MPPLGSLEKTLIAVALSQMSMVAPAANIEVGESCSLADAIRSANQSSSVGTCTAGVGLDNTIILPANSTITLTAPAVDGEDYGDSGLPLTYGNITIQGNGSTIERSSAPATLAFRIMGMTTFYNHTLTLNSLTLSNGLADGGSNDYGYGGAINLGDSNSLVLNDTTISNNFAAGTLGDGFGGAIHAVSAQSIEINNSVISGNSAGNGGAIFSAFAQSIELNNSIISNNSAAYKGGGAEIDYAGALTISQSLLSNNRADTSTTGYPGGALLINSGDNLSITNSTLSGNSAEGGAAIYLNAGQLELFNTTVSDNHNAGSEGSLFVTGNASYPPAVTLNNTVIANSSNVASPVDCSSSYTLILGATASWVESFDASLSCLDGGPVPASITQGDPNLTSLKNSGDTQLHEPLFSSGLIDAGDTAVCAAPPVSGVDQVGTTRGIFRCTIGAAEPPKDTFFVIPIGANKAAVVPL
jgi:hypothetical protein